MENNIEIILDINALDLDRPISDKITPQCREIIEMLMDLESLVCQSQRNIKVYRNEESLLSAEIPLDLLTRENLAGTLESRLFCHFEKEKNCIKVNMRAIADHRFKWTNANAGNIKKYQQTPMVDEMREQFEELLRRFRASADRAKTII